VWACWRPPRRLQPSPCCHPSERASGRGLAETSGRRCLDTHGGLRETREANPNTSQRLPMAVTSATARSFNRPACRDNQASDPTVSLAPGPGGTTHGFGNQKTGRLITSLNSAQYQYYMAVQAHLASGQCLPDLRRPRTSARTTEYGFDAEAISAPDLSAPVDSNQRQRAARPRQRLRHRLRTHRCAASTTAPRPPRKPARAQPDPEDYLPNPERH
jgi:hypothetical protein